MGLAQYKEAARPTVVYVACLLTAAITAAVIFQVPVPAGVTMEILGPLWAYAGYYAKQRTVEKVSSSDGAP